MAARSFDRSKGTPGASRSRGAGQPSESDASIVAGVRWLGVEDGSAVVESGRGSHRDAGRNATLIIGTTHGPRLLEIVGACAC
jgi:hypothetical protein